MQKEKQPPTRLTAEEREGLELISKVYDQLIDKAEEYKKLLYDLTLKRKHVNDELKHRKRLNRIEAQRIHEIREQRDITPYLNRIVYNHQQGRNKPAEVYSFSNYLDGLTQEKVDEILNDIPEIDNEEILVSIEEAKDLVRFQNELEFRIKNNHWDNFPLTPSQSNRILIWFKNNWDIKKSARQLDIDARSFHRGLTRTLSKLNDKTIVSHLKKIIWSIPLGKM